MNEFKGHFSDTTSFTGKLDTAIVEIHPKYESLEIIPTTETQTMLGSFDRVTVAGDENLKAENISKGISIFGVEGTANTTSIKITDASYLFQNRARLDYMNEFLALCENVTNMTNMFYDCDSLTELDLSNFDTSNVTGTGMYSLFSGCARLETLNIKGFDTSGLTELRYVFSGCVRLTSIDVSSFNTSKVTNFYEMFKGCKSLTSLDVSNFDTSRAFNFTGMFRGCTGLTELDLSNFDMSKATSVSNILYELTALEKLKSFKNLGKGYAARAHNSSSLKLDLSTSTNLTHESLMDVINNLYDLNLTYNVANGGTLYRQALVLGSTNLAKLTAEEIAIATNKGWNVS